jgi:MFS family permease
MLALAVAMGIGRFAFTPLLPLMMRDGQLDAAGGAEWAAANYLGYLLGALSAPRLAQQAGRGIRGALLAIATATALATAFPPPWAGALLRLAAGVGSAWVLVLASSTCLAALARRGQAQLGGWIYAGVGLGISAAAALAWVAGSAPANRLWQALGLLALAGTALVARHLPDADRSPAGAASTQGTPSQPAGQSPTQAAARPDTRAWTAANDPAASGRTAGASPTARAMAPWVLCYGLAGFGYIVPATFLPAMARAQIDDPRLFGAVWPVFGLAAALSVALVVRVLPAVRRERIWAGAQAVLALGALTPVLDPRLPALAFSALCVGGTFMVITMAGLQFARQQAPAQATTLIARMTAAFALGQISGPLLVRALAARPAAAAQATAGPAIDLALGAAAVLLLLSVPWLWRARPPSG